MQTDNKIIGIDKLVLTTKDYNIKDFSLLDSHSLTTNKETDFECLIDSFGITKTIAHHNTNKVNISIGAKGLKIQVNPNKLINPYKLTYDLGYTNEIIKNELHKIGIDTDIKDTNISRLDIAKQSQMKQKVSAYNLTLMQLSAKRMQGKDYATGMQYKNTQRKFIFYDKRAELIHNYKKKKLDYSFITKESNLMRAELQMLTSKSVFNTTKIRTFNKLIETPKDQVLDIYNNYLMNNIINDTKVIDIQGKFNFETEQDIFENFYLGKPNAWAYHLRELQARDNYNSRLNNIVLDFYSKYYSSRTIKRIKKEMQLIDSRHIEINNIINNKKDTPQLTELIQKFA